MGESYNMQFGEMFQEMLNADMIYEQDNGWYVTSSARDMLEIVLKNAPSTELSDIPTKSER
jgi:hypothetical protein